MKALPWIVFSLMVLAQWAAPLHQARKHEQVLTQGTLFKFKCRAPDPFDPLRGRFLTVSIENANASLPKDHEWKGGETVFVTLTVDGDGFARLDQVSATPPANTPYLICKLPSYLYATGETTSVEIPFSRYYLNETAAPIADGWLRRPARDRNQPTWVEVRVLAGVAVITDIVHDGKSVTQYIQGLH